MALRYEIDPVAAHVRLVGTGPLTMPAMLAAVEAIATDPRFESRFTVLFDMRDADYTAELSDGDAFVTTLKRRQADFQNRFAILVPAHLHFLARLYSVLATAGGFDRMQCFTDLQEAQAWCGLSRK